MTLLQAELFVLISTLVLIVWYRGRRIKALEAERPILNLQNFKSLYHYEALIYGDERGDVIVDTCIRTAEDMGVKITVHAELDEEIKKEETRVLGDIYDPLAAERLKMLRHLHHLLP